MSEAGSVYKEFKQESVTNLGLEEMVGKGMRVEGKEWGAMDNIYVDLREGGQDRG